MRLFSSAKTAVTLSAFLFTAACATGSSYYQAGNERDYGYYDTRIDENRYRVQYRHRGDNIGEAQDYALLRASELTLQRGYDWFQILDRATDVVSDKDAEFGAAVATERTVTRDCGLLGCRTTMRPSYSVGASAGTYADREDTIVVIEVLMGNNPIPRTASAYDARDLRYSIESRRR